MTEKKNLKGVGGWLILPIIGMFITIGLQLVDLIDTVAYYDIYMNMGLIIWNLLFIIMGSFSLVCIFKGLKLGRTIVPIYYGLILINNILIMEPIGFIGGIIWGSYFLFSTRVKNTLVK